MTLFPEARSFGMLTTGLDTREAKKIESELLKEAPAIKESADEYQGALLTAFSPGANFYLYVSFARSSLSN